MGFDSLKVRTRIHCCNGCVPPKRQVGCHGWWKEYLAEKEEQDNVKTEIYNNRAKENLVLQAKFDAVERIKKRHKK